MADSFACPRCGARYGMKPELAGKHVKCQKCGTAFTVPSPVDDTEATARMAAFLDEAMAESAAAPAAAASRLSRPASAAEEPSRQPSPDSGRSWTMSNSTSASNPGRLKVQWTKYLTSYPEELLMPLIGGTVGVILAPILSEKKLSLPLPVWIAIGAVFVVGYAAWSLFQRREHFWHGCVCPAVVISDDPYLIAAASDMSTGGGFCPAIKIMKQPLEKMTGGPPSVGTRLATVATYRGSASADHWRDFEPLVVNCVTRDEEAIDRVMQGIPPAEWNMLEQGMDQIPKNLRRGKIFFLE